MKMTYEEMKAAWQRDISMPTGPRPDPVLDDNGKDMTHSQYGISRQGQVSPFKGKKHSDEWKKARSEAVKAEWVRRREKYGPSGGNATGEDHWKRK